MSSTRYRTILALFDDPLYRLAAERELRRRGPSNNFLPTPIPLLKDGGSMRVGYVYLSKDFVEVRGCPSSLPYSVVEKLVPGKDFVSHIFYDMSDWYYVTGDEELGPFDTSLDAIRAAEGILREAGYSIVDFPWDEDDIVEFPIRPDPC